MSEDQKQISDSGIGREIPTDIATQIGHFATAELPEDLQITEEAQKVTPQQRSYCALRVRGFSSAAACRQLKINIMTASRWNNAAWFDPVCEEERKGWLESSGIDVKRELMLPLVGRAIDAISSSLQSDNEKIRLEAVNVVLEAFFDSKKPVGRPRILKEEYEQTENTQDLSDVMSAAQTRIISMSERITTLDAVQIRANAG